MEMDIDVARADAMLGSRAAAAMRLRSAIVLFDKKSPPQPALLARALDGLADVTDRNRQEPLLRRALQLRSGLVPPNPVLVAQSLNQLGNFAPANGQSDAAERFFRKALQLLE